MKHFFKDKVECEEFFRRMAKNDGKELTPEYIFEGNSSQKYEFIQTLADMFGYENIGVDEDRFILEDIDFVDTVYVNFVNTLGLKKPTKNLWIDADEMYIDTNGILKLWWD